MGGNAFQTPCARVPSRAELARVVALVKTAAEERFGDKVVICMPAELADKESFGDIDLHYTFFAPGTEEENQDDENVCSNDHSIRRELSEEFFDTVYQKLGCTERTSSKNGFVSMRSQEGYQIDLMYVSPETFPLANLVKSNGDMWWLINVGLRQQGLVLNESGLCIRGAQAKPCALQKNLVLSIDPIAILEFLGFPVQELWEQLEGTESKLGQLGHPLELKKERVFELVFSCKYFTPLTPTQIVHDLGKSNSEAKRRKSTRPMFGELATWLCEKGVLELSEDGQFKRADIQDSAVQEQVASYESNLACAAAAFGKTQELHDEIALSRALKEETEYKERCKQKLDGNVVKTRKHDLTGPAVGQVLLQLRGESWKECWVSWLEKASQEDVLERVDIALANTANLASS